MRSQKYIVDVLNSCKEELSKIDISYGKIIGIETTHLDNGKYGVTKEVNLNGEKCFKIQISDMYADERTSLNGLRGVIFHELLHTVSGGLDHGNKWDELAGKVEKKYPECHVALGHAGQASRGIPDEVYQEIQYNGKAKYIVCCKQCKEQWFFTRKTNMIAHPEEYNCQCGGKIEVRKIS